MGSTSDTKSLRHFGQSETSLTNTFRAFFKDKGAFNPFCERALTRLCPTSHHPLGVSVSKQELTLQGGVGILCRPTPLPGENERDRAR